MTNIYLGCKSTEGQSYCVVLPFLISFSIYSIQSAVMRSVGHSSAATENSCSFNLKISL